VITVGRVKEIWRYPVKGMAGEALRVCNLTDRGLAGDRVWALRDEIRREIQSCKFRPRLLLCSARCRDDRIRDDVPQVEVTFPDGTTVASDDATIHARLSGLTGYASTLEPLRPASEADFYRRHKLDDHTWLEELKATFDREAGEALPDFSQLPPVLVDHVSVPGTFFLVTPLHFVTTATLQHLRQLDPQADWDARRFRPNIVIETAPEFAGLAEQDWIGKRVVFGSAAVECVGATPRCGAVTRAQPGLKADTGVLRTVVRHADQNVGVYGTIATTGPLSVGDLVQVG